MPQVSVWLGDLVRRWRRSPPPATGREPDTPPLRGLWFALRTIAGVSWPLLCVMLAGRFLSALVPAAALWVQRDLLNALAAALPPTRALAGVAAPVSVARTAANPAGHLLDLLILLLGLNALAFALGVIGTAAEGHLREWVGHAIARRHHETLAGADLEEFERPRFWDRASRTWNGAVIIESLDGTLGFFSSVVNLLATLGVLLRVRWEIAPIIALGALPTLWSGLANNRENLAFFRGTQPRQRRIAILAELLTDSAAALEVRLFDIGTHLRGLWRTQAEAQRREQYAVLLRQRPRSAVAILCRLAAFGAAFVTVAVALAHGHAGIGDVTLVVEAIPGVQGLLAGMLNGAAGISYSGQYAADTAAFFETTPPDPMRGAAPFPVPICDGIRFEDVHFHYPESNQPILQGLDLFIPAGRTLAVVGRNGVGKTTLIKLLLGIYRPTSGRITVDGRDLGDHDPQDLRRNLAAVFQDFTRFNLTVRENVAFGNLALLQDDAALLGVLRRVGLGEMVAALPLGLDTVLSKEYEDGAELSGGQWQRIAIARALLRPAQVMVLDEPTAALDPLAEVAIFRHFRDLAAGHGATVDPTDAPPRPRTTLLISHRLGVARLADTIAVIEQGRLTELGSHQELLARGGTYATMFTLQAGAYEPARAGGR